MQPIATYRTERGRLALVYQTSLSPLAVRIEGGILTRTTPLGAGETVQDAVRKMVPEAARTLRVFYQGRPRGGMRRFGEFPGWSWRRRPAGA